MYRSVCGQRPLGRGPSGISALHSQQGCGVPALGYGRVAAGKHPRTGARFAGQGGSYACAPPPLGPEDSHAASLSSVPACRGACCHGQCPATSRRGGSLPQACHITRSTGGALPGCACWYLVACLYTNNFLARPASNYRITRGGAEGGLLPSMRWLQVLGSAVAVGARGLTVGGLRAALGSDDASVRHVAARVRACVLEPAW